MRIDRTEYEFLLRANKFCGKIDKYAGLLNLEYLEVEDLKSECAGLDFVMSQIDLDSGYPKTFVGYKLQNLRINFSHFAQCCKNSKNYTVAIGMELGLEVPVYAFLSN